MSLLLAESSPESQRKRERGKKKKKRIGAVWKALQGQKRFQNATLRTTEHKARSLTARQSASRGVKRVRVIRSHAFLLIHAALFRLRPNPELRAQTRVPGVLLSTHSHGFYSHLFPRKKEKNPQMILVDNSKSSTYNNRTNTLTVDLKLYINLTPRLVSGLDVI